MCLRKKTLVISIMLFAVALIGVAFAGLNAKLTFEESTRTNMRITSMNRQYVKVTTEKPEGLTDVPKGLSDSVYYAEVLIGGNEIFAIIDNGADPAKLYIDIDADGSLADEKPEETKAERGRLSFPGAALASGNDGIVPKANIDFWGGSGRGGSCMLTPAGFYFGTVKIGDKEHKIALIDTNFNGRYDDTFTPPYVMRAPAKFDFMAFDLNGDGNLVPGYPVGEVFPMPKLLKLDGKYYSMKVAANGKEITFNETTPKTGVLDIGSSDIDISIVSDSGFHKLNGKKKYDLAAGKYQAIVLQLSTKDDEGNNWVMQGRSGFGKLENFEIKAGNTIGAEIGTPLTVTASVAGSGKTRSISAVVKGRAGEDYTASVTKNNKLEPAPTVRIRDEKGKVLAVGVLEYG